jgi:hypothetical protein
MQATIATFGRFPAARNAVEPSKRVREVRLELSIPTQWKLGTAFSARLKLRESRAPNH